MRRGRRTRNEAIATVESTGQAWPGYACRNGVFAVRNAVASSTEARVKLSISAASACFNAMTPARR
ncbi:hypothetical protein AB0H36_38730 [Kribbella sp. NPDC050820]|uniref:hypothetical protein n=1 Tax=Kribbella sp. NPDC050820 TaxID=3155408 RepID=UPI0034069C75